MDFIDVPHLFPYITDSAQCLQYNLLDNRIAQRMLLKHLQIIVYIRRPFPFSDILCFGMTIVNHIAGQPKRETFKRRNIF